MATALEIERKFLVSLSISALRAKYDADFIRTEMIEQGYLSDTGDWAIRLRQVSDGISDFPNSYLTMKRRISDEVSHELETVISWKQYDDWKACFGRMLKKRRHLFRFHNQVWYVDEFTQPELNGLVIAEIEFENEGEEIDLPEWAGEEVTNDPQYRNFRLVKRLK